MEYFWRSTITFIKIYSNFHYYEYKGGINYKVHKNINLTLGAGSNQTYKEGGDFVLPKNNDEFRIWPQVILFQPIGKLKIEQHYRAEFRFTSNGYATVFVTGSMLLILLEKNEINSNPFKLVQVMKYFLRTKNLILKEIECYLRLTTNHQKQQPCKLAIYINLTTK